MTEHRTEFDGWAAVWLLDHARIRMMRVDATIGGQPPLLVVDVPTTAPDLVTARERFPRLTGLWDAVRRDYWDHLVGRPS